jgi:hypothetical protein
MQRIIFQNFSASVYICIKGIIIMPENRVRTSEVLLIAKDETGTARCINLTGVTVELVIPAPKADGGTADLKRRLAEAVECIEFYADEKGYARRGRGQSKVQADGGGLARDTLAAIRERD